MSRLRGLFVALVLFGVGLGGAGCGKKGTFVDLTVDQGSLDVTGVTRVDLNLTFNGSQMTTVTLGGGDGGAALTFPQTTRLEIGSNQGGDLLIDVVAFNGAGQRLEGSTEINVASGATTRATVTLGQNTTTADGGTCTAGQMRCRSDNKTPEKCVSGSWQAQTACSISCTNGTCATCTPSSLHCSSTGVPQKCKADGSGYTDQPACPSSTPLCDPTSGMCVSSCTANDKRCSPTAPVIQQCDLQGIWRDTTTCPYACTGSGATTACGGDCEPQSRSCGDNQTPYLCDATGTNQAQTACQYVCSGAGACTGQCKPYTTRCKAGSTTAAELCDVTGSWGPGVTCAYICDTTTSKCAGECSPNSPAQCSGNSVETCSSAGHWTVTTTCTTSTCSRGMCRPCTANEHQCNNGKPQTCNSSGVWMDDQATACPFICDASTGKCAGQCVPDSDVCAADGQTSKHCKADGTYDTTTCPNVCDQTTGRCGGVCVPNTHRCNGSMSQTCGPDGQWGGAIPCANGCDATMGQCAACTDEPQATTCMGDKCGMTSNNCGHTVMCSASCPGTGESCGGGGVAGICGCRPEPAAQTCQAGALCGNAMNNCGAAVACGDTCVAPQTCGGVASSPNTCGCTPMTAATACTGGKNCDTVSDGCGGTVACGSCASPQTCGGGGTPNVCGCTPKKQSDACGSRVCGTMPDGCGGNVSCGASCPSGQFCSSSNGQCVSSCTPMTACPTGKNCGTVDNGCGTAMLTCGTMSGNCPSGQTCGGGNPGTANVCGCTPMTMTVVCAGKNCDPVSDGCGGTISCGSCTSPQTCGGGGTANACGCTPKTKAQVCTGGKNCGSVADGCGGNVDCGGCTAPQSCGGGGTANVCGCTPLTAAQACPAGQNCNTAPDACGGTVSCGTCTSPQSCGGGGTPNKCGCTPATSCGTGTNCGTKADNCGGTITCGSATCGTGSGQGCGAVTANICGCTRNAMSVTCSGKCGVVSDNCGASVDCGTSACTGSQVCAQSPATSPNVCCTPESDTQMCSRLVNSCGSVTATDNCGTTRTITNCGTCTAPQICGGSGVCGCVAESDSAFCTRLGKTCGSVTATDNCGASRTVTSCGTCGTGQVCESASAPSPNNCCTPQTDAQICSTMGKNCGSTTVTDNCGTTRTVSCGTCTAPLTCAGGSPSVPNVCGCTAETNAAFCSRLGATCGQVTANDNCGASRTVSSCGTCTPPQSCGGGGSANVCGCTAETNTAFCSRLGATCGQVTANDNCGASRTVSSCGTCASPQSCGGGGTANMCGCTAETNTAFCSRLSKNCGSVTANDNCGASRTVTSCGTCAPPQTCGGGGTANMCGCTAETNTAFCSRLGDNCGQVTANDNCGTSRTVSSCGTCAPPQTCGGGGAANMCGCAAETNTAFCSRLGKNCGSVTANDNCGTSRTVTSCGSCTNPQSCGGGGTANVCGCTPLTAAQACTGGQNCGTASDNCGGTVSCGTCTVSGQTCQSNHCACPSSIPNICSNVCVTTTGGDAANCGSCGHSCLGGTCQGGTCLPSAIGTTASGIGLLATNSTSVFCGDSTNMYSVPKTKSGSGTPPLTPIASPATNGGSPSFIAATDTLLMWAETFSTFGGVQTSLYSCTPTNCAATLSTWYSNFNGYVTCDIAQQRCFTQDSNGNLFLSTSSAKAAAPFPNAGNQANIGLGNTGPGGISLTAAGGFLYAFGGPGGSSPTLFSRIPEDGSTSVVTILANMGNTFGAPRPPVIVTSSRAYFNGAPGNVFGPDFIYTVTLPLGNGNNPAPMFAGSTDFSAGGTYYADANAVYWFDTTSLQLVTCPPNGCTGAPTPVASGTSGALTSDGQALYWVVSVGGMTNIMKLAR